MGAVLLARGFCCCFAGDGVTDKMEIETYDYKFHLTSTIASRGNVSLAPKEDGCEFQPFFILSLQVASYATAATYD